MKLAVELLRCLEANLVTALTDRVLKELPIIGALAGPQRHYYSGSEASCARAGTIATR